MPQDVMDRRRTETALAESEALKSAILESALDCIITIDGNGAVVEWNPAAERTFGITRGTALGCRIADLIIPPEHRDAHRRGLAHYLATGEGPVLGRRIEVEAQRMDGSRFPVELAITPSTAGGITLFTAYLRDITERKQAEAALRESEFRLRELLATVDLGAFMARDLSGIIRFWSQGCKQLYGWTAEEAVGRAADGLLGTIFPLPFSEIETLLVQDGEWTGDLVQRRRDGTTITVAARKALRRDANGHPVALVESVADVTALRTAKAELQRLNESLETRVREEMQAREAAQVQLAQTEKMTALGQLAGGIAHDFNNVLQAVSGGAALIGRRSTSPEMVRQLAEMIEESARRGASVTRRLLAFARRGELQAEPLVLARILEALLDILAHTLGAEVEVRLSMVPDLPCVFADRGQLETALINLATNARDAMPQGGTLILSACPELISDIGNPQGLLPGNYVRLSLADNGVGMDEATLGRIMEPFFTTKGPGKGTGLGLPMVRGFAEQSGGALAVTSEPGRGTTATLWLPVRDSVCIHAKHKDPTAHRSPGHRVLLVDDEGLVREVLAAGLADRGYEVLQAASGAAALAILAAGEVVHLLISDLSMPLMDGISLIREAQKRRPGLPTILLTGHAGSMPNAALAEDLSGSFSLLRKPVTCTQLADRVAALLVAMELPQG